MLMANLPPSEGQSRLLKIRLQHADGKPYYLSRITVRNPPKADQPYYLIRRKADDTVQVLLELFSHSQFYPWPGITGKKRISKGEDSNDTTMSTQLFSSFSLLAPG